MECGANQRSINVAFPLILLLVMVQRTSQCEPDRRLWTEATQADVSIQEKHFHKALNGPGDATFEWVGEFYQRGPVRTVSWVKFRVNVQIRAHVACDTSWGEYINRWYAVDSAVVVIALDYFTYQPSETMPPPNQVRESQSWLLTTSDFLVGDVGCPPLDPWERSFISEQENPMFGLTQVFLRSRQTRRFSTPNGAQFTFGSGGEGVDGGLDILVSTQFTGPGMLPDASTLEGPAGYYSLSALPIDEDLRTFGLLYPPEASFTRIRYLDPETSEFVWGAVCDGASQAVVEILDVQSAAEITMPAGFGEWADEPSLTGDTWRRTWQAPDVLPPEPAPQALDNGIREVAFQIRVDGENLDAPRFELRHAPVVFIHGIWSTAEAWQACAEALSLQGFPPAFLYCADYRSTHQESFSVNRNVVPLAVEHSLAVPKFLGLVAKKVDIVAHSMGGSLSKLYGPAPKIHRIATVGATHFGSPLADWAFDHQDDALGAVYQELLRALFNEETLSFGSGAVKDLRTDPELGRHVDGAALGPAVRALALNGVASFDVNLPGIGFLGRLCTQDTTDLVVCGTSQRGGLTAPQSEDVAVLSHVHETGNQDVCNAIADFLTGPADKAQNGIAADLQVTETVPKTVAHSAEVLQANLDVLQVLSPQPDEQSVCGEPIHVVVDAPDDVTGLLVVANGTWVFQEGASLIETDLELPEEVLGQTSLFIASVKDTEITAYSTVPIQVVSATAPEDLTILPGNLLFLDAGESLALTILAKFADGVARNVTSSAPAIRYTSTNLSIAVVSPQGILQGKAAGWCTISVEYQQAKADLVCNVKSGSDQGNEGETVPKLLPFCGPDTTCRDDWLADFSTCFSVMALLLVSTRRMKLRRVSS